VFCREIKSFAVDSQRDISVTARKFFMCDLHTVFINVGSLLGNENYTHVRVLVCHPPNLRIS
jgi:hypothetical protein